MGARARGARTSGGAADLVQHHEPLALDGAWLARELDPGVRVDRARLGASPHADEEAHVVADDALERVLQHRRRQAGVAVRGARGVGPAHELLGARGAEASWRSALGQQRHERRSVEGAERARRTLHAPALDRARRHRREHPSGGDEGALARRGLAEATRGFAEEAEQAAFAGGHGCGSVRMICVGAVSRQTDSSAKSFVGRAPLVLAEALTRFVFVAALFALPRDPRVASGLALLAALSTAGRAFLRAELAARGLRASFAEAVAGIRGLDARELASRREDEQGVAMLLDAIREGATAKSLLRAELEGAIVAGVGLGALSIWRFGVPPSLLGLAAVLALIGATTPIRRLGRRAQERSWSAFLAAAAAARTFLEAGIELRAQGADAAHAGIVEARAAELASAERHALRTTAAMAVMPTALAVVAALVPRALLDAVAGAGVDLAVLGLGTISTGLAVVGALDAWQRSAPYREALDALAQRAEPRSAEESAPSTSERQAKLERLSVRDLSVRHPASTRDTPHALSFELARGGVALVGDNGAGKSTALLALLGLVATDGGSVEIDGRAQDPASRAAFLRRVAFLPQRPHLDPGESIAAHLDLFGAAPLERARRDAALERIGLGPTLRARAGGDLEGALTKPMGSLSGGERQRVALARVLASDAGLVVLDEPEAALDGPARERLKELLEELATDRLVLLVAHDHDVIPEGYRRIVCTASATRAAAPA